MDRRRAAGALLALAACIACSAAAPTLNEHTSLDLYDGKSAGCYYNFQHYGEGDRIMTNEPCLNCTCHNRMLMCYLRVCPFTKAIGQDCTVEKRADQCCPIVTCPDVPVDLLTSTSTTSPAEYGGTGVGKPDKYGCSINGRYFPEGSKVPPTPNKPCEHCYCIRNMTTCVMQECTLHVDGCTPIYHKDVCCPVRYSCDHLDDETLLLDDMTTTVRPTPGFLLTTTISSPVTQMTQDCVHDDKVYADGALIKTEKACEHCYCMKGDIVCVVQECGTPMENEGKNCTSLPPREGQCCPDTYICEGDEIATESLERLTTGFVQDEFTTYTPPRRYGVEGSGYRKEPDNTSYTATPPTETESEGSGYEQKLETLHDSNEITPTTVMYEHMTTKIPINEKIKPEKEKDMTEFSEKPREEYEKTTTISETYEAPVTTEEAQKIIDEYHESNEGLTEIPPLEHTELVTKPIKEEFVGETTQEETSLPEDNISTITPESGSKIKITTETAKQDLGTTINTEENDISVTTSGTIFEESEGVTTDKEHDTVSSMVSEKEKPQVSEYNPSTSSTPFLEEVEKVTTEAQEQHIVTDNISDITETFGLHKYGSTISVPEIEVNKESDTISGSNTLPDTEFHEYIPIATSAPIGDETDKRTTVQEDSVTSDFNEEEIKQPHKNIPSTTNLILEEFITTESSISNEISEVHKHIASTTDISVASEYDKRTTETLQHDIVTDRTRKDDDTYQYTLTTTSIVPMTEESLVTEKEKDERVNLSTLTEIDKTITDKYIPTTISTLNLEDHKTTMKDYDDSKEGSGISEKDYSSTEGLSSSKSVEEASTELYKHETSTSKLEEKESYESHKVPSTSALGVEEDYITTTEYSDKDQEFISHEISQSERKPIENAPDSSSTPFLEEIEKATPEVPEGSISSTVGEPAIHTPEKQLPSKDAITSLDEEITTIIEPVNIVEVTSVSSVTFTESYDSVVPEKTQDAHTKHETTIPSTEVSGEKQTYDMDSVTTDASPVSSSSPSSFTIKEDQFPVTTEPSFRKEDNTMQVTSELNRDVITDTPNIESTTIITTEPDETPTASVLPEYIQENQKPVSSHETTDEVNTETVTLNKDNLPVSVDEASIVSTTHAFDKIDLFETTTVNPGENEIQEDLLSSAGRIPGEGDCLLNGVTYRNESVVPSTNKCHSGCRCLSSIITCDPIICSPPPEYMNNCQPTYDSPESCCATYVCDQVRETLPPLPYKHVTTTETPKETISIECQGDECEIRQDKKQPTSVDSSSELCTTSSCSTEFDNQQETSNCGPQGCTSSINNVPSLDTSELCINGKCEQPVVQIHEEELCQGDSCKFVTETHPHGSQEDNKPQEVTSIPCIGDSCTTIQESTNVMTEPQDTAVLCKDENDCSVIDQGCTDDSCRRKEILNIEHKPFCSGVDCEKNQDLPEEPSKDAHYSTYTPDIKPSAEIETTPALSVTSDIITIPSIQHTTDRVPPSDKIPNFISEDQEIVTKLPEIITSSAYPINDFTTLPDIFITENQEPNIDKPQKPIGESHTLETKPPLLDEQNVSSEQSSITATEDTIVNIGYETSTEFSEDKVNKEEETDMKIDELENNLNKPKDHTIVPVLPITGIEKETTTLENAISTSFDTNTKAPLRDVSATTTLDTDEDEISTAKPHEYSTSYVNFEEIESGSTIPTHVSGTYEQSSEAPMITNAPVLVPITENEIQVSETKEPLPTLNNQEVTTSARFESENDNDFTTPVDNLELDQVNIITDLPYLHIDADVDNTFKENKPITTAKPDDEVYDTTSHKFSEPTHKTTESILIETEYTESMPIVTSVTDSEVHLTEIDDSRKESPVSTDVEENVNTESPSSYITELGADSMTDDQTKITLPTFETDDKKTETVSPSAVTESEVHIPEVDVSKTTLSVPTDGGEETEIETSASPITESGSHATASEEIITPLPTFVTKEENIASYTPVFSVTEGLQIDNIDRTKEISPISVIDEGQIQPETTSLYETESEDEGKTTLKQEKDHIATGTPDFQITESVVYTTNADEIRTTLPTTYIDKKEKIETSSPSMYVTEPAVHSTETEGTKTTLPTFITKEETVKPEYQSSQVTEKEMFTFPTHERETTFAEYATEHEKAYTEAPSPQFTKIELETTTTFDEIKTTPHTLVTDERVELEFPVTIMTELKPHSDKVTDIETTISTQNTEEEENIIKTQVTQAVEHEQAIDVTSTTLAGQITTERTIQEAVPISPETEPEINLSTLEETRVTIPTYTTETEMIKEEPELPVSPMTILGLHKDKSDESNTVLPTSHVETGTPPSHVTESELHTSDADQTNTLPVAVAEDKNIEPQSISPYVTESGVYATDIDERKSTLSVTTTEKEKLDSETPISQVTELELQVNDVDETRTTTPSSTIKEDVYVSEIHETKTTIPSSIIKEEKTEDKPTTQATQSVSFETETKVPIYVIDTGNTQSDLAVSTEKEVELQTNEVIETQPTQSTSVGEEEKNKLVTPSSEVTESKDQTNKLEETKTTLPVSIIDNDNVATETSYSQRTESVTYATGMDETRTTSPAPHLSEEEKIGSESPISDVTGSDIQGTVPIEMSSTVSSLPDVEKNEYETKVPVYHLSDTETYSTVQYETKTTTPAFVITEEIKTEASAIPGIESTDLVTGMIEDENKLTTLSEHIVTESEIQTTEVATITEIKLEDTNNINVEKEQDGVKLTTELYDYDAHIKPDDTHKRPLTENTTEMEYVENITTDEEIQGTTEFIKVESISSVSPPEIGVTQGNEMETKVPVDGITNEIYPNLHITEEQRLSTDTTESPSIDEQTPLTQDHYSKSTELLPATTLTSVTISEEINTPSIVENVETPVTASPDIQSFVTHRDVTKESDIYITTSEESVTKKPIDNEQEEVSTVLPATSTSYIDVTTHHAVQEQSTVPVITQEELTSSSEQETPYKITLAPESLTTNLQEVSQTNLDEHHIDEEEQTKIKPTTDYTDSSTIKSEIVTISQEQYFTEKQETIPIEHDSSTISTEITTKKPDAAEINSITTIQTQEETTEHEEIKHVFGPASESTETLPDIVELEEHTHKTLDATTVTSIDDKSTPEKTDLEHQTLEQSTNKASDEQFGIKDTTAINEDTTTSIYDAEKPIATTGLTEETLVETHDTTPIISNQEIFTTSKQEETSTSKQEETSTSKQEETLSSISTQVSEIENVSIPEASIATEKPLHEDKSGTTTPFDEITVTTLKPTSIEIEKESPTPVATTSIPETKPEDTSFSKVPKPVTSVTASPDEISPQPEEEHLPPSGSSGYGGEADYVEEDQAFGPGTCRYGGKVYVSAQQIPRDDPCDFCFCFRSDIICLQQSCPPPIHGCHEEPIQGFCCPRYECPVSMATTLNVTTTTTTTTTTLPPHFPTHSYKGAAQRRGCQIKGHTYKVGEVVRASSGPCLHCTCGGDGQMKCDPKACTPEPMLRQMIAAAVSAKRRR